MLKRSLLAGLFAFVLPLPGLSTGEEPVSESVELDAAAAEAVDDVAGNRALEVRLTEASRAALGEFTAKHVGWRTEVLIGGAVVTSPVIHEPILGGSLIVTGGPETNWAALAALLRQGGKITVRLAK